MEEYIKVIVYILVMVGLGFMFGDMMKQKREEAVEKELRLENCFKQEPRTKDCEFIIWQYEVSRCVKK